MEWELGWVRGVHGMRVWEGGRSVCLFGRDYCLREWVRLRVQIFILVKYLLPNERWTSSNKCRTLRRWTVPNNTICPVLMSFLKKYFDTHISVLFIIKQSLIWRSFSTNYLSLPSNCALYTSLFWRILNITLLLL